MKLAVKVSLHTYTWAQVDDLIGYLGESRSEVITFILTSWFAGNGKMIDGYKAAVDVLRAPTDGGGDNG